jgi:metal-sulfur cluster biosynthetic enzyme
MQEDLERALNEVEDPELGIRIVDLGLIYRAEWTKTGIEVEPSCPYAELLHEQIDSILRKRFREASVVADKSDTTGGRFALHCWGPVGITGH